MLPSLLLLSLLSQATQGGARPAPALLPVSFSDGRRTVTLYESARLVAEPAPNPGQREALLRADPAAVLVVDRPTMRLWRVADAAGVRGRLAWALPVLHDERSGAGRVRVPLALACGRRRVLLPWREVLARSDGACLPDFFYVATLK